VKWFRKEKEEPEVEPLQAQVVTPRYIVPQDIMDEITGLSRQDAYKAKEIVAKFLKTLNRPELLAFEDADQFRHIEERINEFAWEAYHDEEWQRSWPLGCSNYESTIPDIVTSTIQDYDSLKKQIHGIQKKLDRLSMLMENTEITMSGKTALKL